MTIPLVQRAFCPLKPTDQQLSLENHFFGKITGQLEEQLFLAKDFGLELLQVDPLNALHIRSE
jgi:hypothetical protein